MLRLNQHTKTILNLENRKRQLGFQKGRTIGINVRHGDGCLHGRRKQHGCRSLSDYLMEARTIRDLYGKTNDVIFLATDSAAIIDDAKNYRNEFTFIFQHIERNILQSRIKIESRLEKRELDPHELMVATLIDIFLLSECDYMITHQTSSLSRIALQLATVRLGYVPPYVSMDGPWCYHWRMCCDVKSDGRQSTC